MCIDFRHIRGVCACLRLYIDRRTDGSDTIDKFVIDVEGNTKVKHAEQKVKVLP